VEREGLHPPWAYTVGLTRRRRPELVITGLGLTRATEILNSVAGHLMHADVPAPGTQATLVDGRDVEIVRVDAPWAHLNVAVEIYGQRIQGLQLVHADKRGSWPGTASTTAYAAGNLSWPQGTARAPDPGRVTGD